MSNKGKIAHEASQQKYGQCAKRKVTCVLIDKKGNTVEGTNWCLSPQEVCPRKDGEGYSKCLTVCGQTGGHAEIDAIRKAGEFKEFKIQGSTAILIGHDHYCRDCQIALFDAGVASLRRMKK